MLWAIILLILPSVLLLAYVLLADRRRKRTPADLRGDWWPGFEAEFRAYVERTASDGRSDAAEDARRRPRDRKPPR